MLCLCIALITPSARLVRTQGKKTELSDMDPNAALESILRGHMMQEHLEALREWIGIGGFVPEPIYLPVDCAPCFSELPRETDLTINGYGLVVCTPNGQGDPSEVRYFGWEELSQFARDCKQTGCEGCASCI